MVRAHCVQCPRTQESNIDQSIRDQLDKVAHVTNLGMSHPVSITWQKVGRNRSERTQPCVSSAATARRR